MNPTETTLILCGGPPNPTNLPLGAGQSNAMVPVNGKPVIGWILDELLFKGIRRATVVVREENTQLRGFVERVYRERMELRIATVRDSGSIVRSMQAGLEGETEPGLVRVVLGDTLIRDSFTGDRDFVYTAEVEDSRRWCVAVTGAVGEVVRLIDKQELDEPPFQALAGYYHLRDGALLRAAVDESVLAGDTELSDVLRRYMAVHPLQAQQAREWFDFGHIDNLVGARRRLLQPRYFNALTINPVLNTITKVSQHTKKLEEELAWFQLLPEELKVLTPRVLATRDAEGNVSVSQEYYGYPTLAELYVYGDLPREIWSSVMRKVLLIHQEFRRHPGELEPEHVHAMYGAKTWDRLDALRGQDPAWQEMLDAPVITYQGRELRNVDVLRDAINRGAERLAGSAPISIIHGDYCFSNILFDVNNQIVRLIDPRGSFGKSGIYGDARYDIAKLRHSLSGLYDFVMADMFDVRREADGSWTSQVYADARLRSLAGDFDRMVAALGYDVNEIRFIEGLLFVSMVPYHHGHPRRQQLLYLTGLTLLNDVL
ncbi:phosphotransferase [Longimicrobium terrae]|uniref:dTDP-glucose pyrophosphorylase n=1 Tax=Longimicrobium terrae TaxID=1639882 RepID=A0A841GMS8_9BACT|nr:phosphotransferase [Longimicrobium terrae]MBB4634498.1 dTDP-glucose pyrophosphorylase [Longimicrobium terrae]MBB6068612.1 dTDP-glucose pyrophosphorylase [Longimicrobium terrae]NNC27798.1 phosphotransferase [Longimicrobium terrae]